jgi:ribokinase
MATEWDVVVVGGVNTDYLVRGSKLPVPGETADGEDFQEAPGGKGDNQTVAAARLGAHVTLVARLGKDRRGGALAEHLVDEGVDTRYLVYDREAPTGAAVIMVDRQGHKQILTALGANRRLTLSDVRAAEPAIRRAKVVLAQLEVPLEPVVLALQMGREAGAYTVLDPAPAVPLPDEVLQFVDVIRPNAGEARVLTGMHVRNRATARRAAGELLRRGVGAAAVEAGEEGNLLLWHGGERWLPKLPVKSVDATGAGDAFAAALAVLLAEDRQLHEAGTFANAAAALATTALGAQAGMPRREDVQALLARTGRGFRALQPA